MAAGSFLGFLESELAPRPGRVGDAARITALTLLVLAVSEIFRMPLASYSVYIVFFLSKEEAASTIVIGIAAALAVTAAVAAALLMYAVSAGEPALRLPLMAAAALGGMFLSRASPVGLLGLVIGFVITLALTLIDTTPVAGARPSVDLLTREVLWLWPVIMLPLAALVAGNALTGRDPVALCADELALRLRLAGGVLSGRAAPGDREKLRARADDGTAALVGHLKAAALYHPAFRGEKPVYEARVARVERLVLLALEWAELGVSDSTLLAEASARAEELVAAARALEARAAWPVVAPGGARGRGRRGRASGLLDEIAELTESLRAPRNAPREAKPRLLAPDAFSDPEYARFALKVTLAIFIVYFSYSLLDWPGIRTCMVTCFFVSLGTYGETARKMALRLAGALLGAGLGLGTVVFLMPHLTTLVGLLGVCGAVSFAAAWVSTSSERLSYAGLQMALAFFFSVLVGWGPSIALEEARDRVVGILFGNLVVSVVFAFLWPVAAEIYARRSVVSALERLGAFLREPDDEDGFFLAFDASIAQARRYASLEWLEPREVRRARRPAIDSKLIEAAGALGGPALALSGAAREPASPAGGYARAVGGWLEESARGLPAAAIPSAPPRAGEAVSAREDAAELDRRARALHALLQKRARLAAGLAALGALAGCASTERLAPAAADRPWRTPAASTATATFALQTDPALPYMEPSVPIDPSRVYTLPELIDIAQRANPDTRVAWEEARQAAFSVGIVEASYLPQLTAEVLGGFQHTPLPVPRVVDPRGHFETDTSEVVPGAVLKWLLFDFGKRGHRIEAAKQASRASNIAFTGAHQKLIFDVSKAYFALDADRAQRRAAEEALEDTRVLQSAAEAKNTRGLETITAVSQARRATAKARFDLEYARAAENDAYHGLLESMGLQPTLQLQVAASSGRELAGSLAAEARAYVDRALARRPDLLAALAKLRGGEAAAAAERASYYPTIGAMGWANQNVGQLNINGGPSYRVREPAFGVLFSLSFPLYDGGLRRGEIGVARSKAEAAKDALVGAQDAAIRQVARAYDAVKSALAEYDAALALASASDTAYAAALESYRRGVGPITSVVDSATNKAQAHYAQAQAYASALTAAAALAFSTGELTSKNAVP